MSDHEYIFRIPAGTPELTYDALTAYEAAHWHPYANGDRYAPIGTTVTVTRETGPITGCPMPDRMVLRLYGLAIARIERGYVYFPQTGDAHIATSYWLAAVVRANGIGGNVWRIRRRKADGPGPEVARGRAGLLVIDGDRNRPVEGHGYLVKQPALTADDVITAVTRAATETGAITILRKQVPLGMMLIVADQLHIETAGHDTMWICRAIVREAKS